MKKRVLFISNVKPLSGRLSSTDIMTINLIEGLSKCNVDLSLLILTENSDIADLYKDYQQYANKIIVSKRQFHEGQSIFKSVFGSLFNALFPGFYKKNINVIRKNNSLDFDIVISNTE